jgi:EmrB/QacA subfamily drug resistance transporter
LTPPLAERPLRLNEPVGRWVLLATVLGSSLAMLDSTIVNVALQQIGTDLGADLGDLQWTLSGYSLTVASFVLLGGSLGDRFGRRRLFLIGTGWFTIASVLCGLAPNVELLIAARALQGIGGALLTPGSLAIISASFAPEDRPRAIGAWSGFGGIAGAIGPFLGGWLVDSWSWRLVFLVNLPLAAVVIAVTLAHVPESWAPGRGHGLDAPGAGLGTLGLAALTYASITAGREGARRTVVFTGAVGVLALVAFMLVERWSATPLVPPRLFASRQFTVANLFTFSVYAALSAVFFLLVLDLQVVAGYGPLAAGISMLPVTAVMLVLSSRFGAIAQRIGPKLQLTAGPLIAAAGLLLTLRIGSGASYVTVVLPAVTLFGLGLAMFVAPLTAAVLAATPPEHVGVASAVNNAVARSAGLLGVALLPAIAGLSGDDYQKLNAFAAGYRLATLVDVALLVVGAVLAAIAIGNELPQAATKPDGVSGAQELTHCYSCPVEGPRLESIQPARRGT